MGGRHLAPEELHANRRVPLRVVVARLLPWAGRLHGLMLLASVLWCRVTADSWSSSAADHADTYPDVLPVNVTMLLAVVTVIVWPLCLLPVTSAQALNFEDGSLVAPTVLGTRRVPLGGARLTAAYVPGRGWGMYVFLLRNQHRWVVVAASELYGRPSELPNTLRIKGVSVAASAESVQRGTSRGRPMLSGLVLLLMWVAIGFGLMGAVILAAGLE